MKNFIKNKKLNKKNANLENTVTFIKDAGGCIITRSLFEGKSRLKWLYRSESVNPVDNGWRAFGDTDTDEYVSDSENHLVVDFNTLANIEPSVLDVYDYPIGTDLEFHDDEMGKYFTDNYTGKRIN